MHTAIGILTFLGYVLTLALLPVVLLTKKRQSVSTVAWIMAIIMMPYFGAFLFLIFGANFAGIRLKGKQAATKIVSQMLPQLAHHHHLEHDQLDETSRELRRLAERIAGTRPTVGNRIQLLIDADRTFQRDSVSNCRREIVDPSRILHLAAGPLGNEAS